ncbi:IS630 family transposase, partial [Myxacorys almedinensis]
MPVRNYLSQMQQANLQKAVRESEDRHTRQRALILLLRNDGKTYEEISAFLNCSYRSVAHWCVEGNPDDLESLRDGRSEGNYRKATPAYIEQLMRVVEQSPSELGYELGRWTAERLAVYLAENTGIALSGMQVRRILKQKKYVYLWAKYSLEDKQNPQHRQAFRAELRQKLAVSVQEPAKL